MYVYIYCTTDMLLFVDVKEVNAKECEVGEEISDDSDELFKEPAESVEKTSTDVKPTSTGTTVHIVPAIPRVRMITSNLLAC